MQILVFFIALASSLVTLWRTGKMPVVLDYSYFIENAYRIFLGQVPYRDFLLVVSPGTYFIGAWIMKLFGTGYVYQKLFIMSLSFATVILTYMILQLINRNKILNLFLLVPLIFAGHAVYALPSYDMNAIFFILLGMYLILKLHVRKTNSARDYFIIGFVSLVPPLFKQNTGIGFAFFALLFIAVYILVNEGKNKCKKLLSVAGGAMSVLLPFVLYLMLTRSLTQFVYMAFIFQWKARHADVVFTSLIRDAIRPRSLLYYIPFVLAGFLVIKKKIANLQLMLIILYGTLLSPFLYAAYLYFKYRNLLSDMVFVVGFAQLYTYAIWFVLYGIFCIIVFYEFAILHRSIKSSYMTIFLIFVVLSTMWVYTLHPVQRATYPIYPVFAMLILYMSIQFKKLLPGYDWNSVGIAISLTSAFFLLLSLMNADIIMFGTSLGLFNKSDPEVKYIQNGEFTNSNPGKWSEETDRMFSFVGAKIPKEDTVVAIPGEDPFYYVTKRKPPLPYFQFIPSTFPYPADDYLKKINDQKIDWVIIKNHLQGNLYMGDVPYMVKHMRKNYGLVTRIGGYDVYKRIPDVLE